jgi:hypothetical protein
MRNCLTYAVGKLWAEGGKLVVRRSLAYEKFALHLKPWWSVQKWLVWSVPHFMHMGYDGRITQFVPTSEEVEKHSNSLWRFWLALWSLNGEVIEGDDEANRVRHRPRQGVRSRNSTAYEVCS